MPGLEMKEEDEEEEGNFYINYYNFYCSGEEVEDIEEYGDDM